MLAPKPPGSTPPRDESQREFSMDAPEGKPREAANGAAHSEAAPHGVKPLAENAEVYAGWVQLVRRIRTSETDGMAELYSLFSKGIRFYLCRQLAG